MAKCLTPEQRATLVSGLTKIDIKAENHKQEIDKSRGKPHRFNTHAITPDMLVNLFGSEATKDTALDEIKKVVGKNNNRYHTFNLLTSTKDMDKNLTIYPDLINPANVIPISIALREVIESIRGEADKARNNNVDISTISNLNNGTASVPYARVAAVIGRKVMYTQGYKISGLSSIATESIYTNLGGKILDMLSKKGIVDVSEGNMINDFVDAEVMKKTRNKPLIKGKVISLDTDALFTSNIPVEEMASIKEYMNKTNDSISDTFDDMITSITRVHNLVTPSQILLPSYGKYGKGYLDTNDITTSDTGAEVQIALNEKPVQVSKSMNSFFTNMADALSGKSNNIKHLMKSIKKQGKDVLTNVFGIEDINAMGVDKTDSMFGKELSKTTPLGDLLQHWDLIKDQPLHMISKYVRNARLHVMNTVLNYQTSKFDRHSLTTGEYSININEEPEVFHHLLAGIKDQSKLDYDVILGSKQEIELDNLLENMDKYFIESDNLERQLGYLNKVAKSKYHTSNNIAQTIETLKAIKDVRAGLESGTITTEFMTKPDGTASGGTLTLLHALGSNPNVEIVLNQLNILKNENVNTKGIELNDVYAILTNAIQNLKEDAKEGILLGGKEELLKFVDTDVFKNLRDLSKDPTMVFVYGQGEKSAKATMSSAFTDKIFSTKDNPKIIEFLKDAAKDIKTPLPVDLKNVATIEGLKQMPGGFATVQAILNKDGGITDALLDLLEKNIQTKYLGNYNALTKELYTELSNIVAKSGEDIKILPALAVFDGIEPTKENINKYGIPLQKVEEILHRDLDVITRQELPAETTAKVNTIHGTDNAILTVALSRAMVAYKKKYGKDFNGSMSVHDANNADAHFNSILENEYIKVTKEVLETYSIHEQLLNTIKALDPSRNMSELETKVKANIKSKKEALKYFDTHSKAIFGFKINQNDIDVINSSLKNLPKRANKSSEPTVEQSDIATPQDNRAKLIEVMEMLPKKSAVLKGFFERIQNETTPLAVNFIKTMGKNFSFNPKTNTLKLGKINKNELEKMDQLVDHEVTHFYLTGYLNSKEGKSETKVKFTQSVLDKINALYKANKFNPRVFDTFYGERLKYILDTPAKGSAQLNEFITIMKTEPEVANQIYAVLNDTFGKEEGIDAKTISTRLERLRDYISKIWDIVANTFKNFEQGNKTLELYEQGIFELNENTLPTLMGSIEGIVSNSMDYRHGNETEALQNQKASGTLYAKKSKPSSTLGVKDSYDYTTYTGDTRYDDFISQQTARLNAYTYNILTRTYDSAGKAILKWTDANLEANVPLYVRTKGLINRTYENSELLQQLVHYLNITDFKDFKAKNDFISKQLIIAQNRTKQDNDLNNKIDLLVKGFSVQEKSEMFKTYSQVPMFHLFNNPEIYDDLVSGMTISDAISKVTSNPKIGTKQQKEAKAIARLLIEGKVTHGAKYNYNMLYNDGDTKFINDFRTLIALESLSLVPNSTDMIKKVNSIPELENTLRDISLALFNLTKNVYDETDTYASYRENMMNDVFSTPVKIIPITEKDLIKYEYNDNGWKVLRKPGTGKIGLAYQEIMDNTMMEGVGTNIEFYSTDVNISKNYITSSVHLENNNILPINEPGKEVKYKMVLTQKEKETIGIVKSPGQALVRSLTHIESIKESQILRDTLLRKSFTTEISTASDLNDLVTEIKNPTHEHAWLVKLPDTMTYASLPREIKAKYKPVETDAHISSIKGFKHNVSLVRKDIAPWLVGYKMPSVFQNNAVMRKVSMLVKEIISVSKIGMVIVNPAKITADLISNKLLLLSNNVPIRKIAVYGKEIATQLQELTELRGEYLATKLSLAADPSDTLIENKLNRLKAKLKSHPLAPAFKNGMITSISTDLVLKDYDTITGLQADLEKIIGSVVMKDKNHMNVIGKFIMRASKLGFNGEDILLGIGRGLQSKGELSSIGSVLENSAKRIKELKSEEDVVKYITQFLVTPDSETTKIGSAATQIIDVVDKMTYYKHLKDIGYSEEQAIKEALELFIDYKVNMPKYLKLLSDYSVLLYPAFWFRAQKIIASLITKKLPTVAAGEAFVSLSGINIPTIMDANIVSKYNQGHIFNMPDIGFDTFIPSNIFRF